MTPPASHERVYRALLRLYPGPFRARFRDELVQLFGDVMRDARDGRGGRGGTGGIWLRILADIALTAPAEHLDARRVAHSLTRPASAVMKTLGLLGIVGGLLLLSVWLPVLSIVPEKFNLGRLVLFNAGAMAIAAAILRWGAGAEWGRFQRSVAALAMAANGWYLVMVVLSADRPVYPVPDPEFREIFNWAGVAMWWADGALGLALLGSRSRARWGALALAVGSVGAFSGMGYLGLIDGELGWLFLPASQVGIALNGLGWILLGIAVTTRRRAIAPTSVAPRAS